MGRMLEAFKLHVPDRDQSADAASAPQAAWPRPALTPPAHEEIPFIEVGGPRATTEASPQVVAARAKLAAKLPLEPRLRAIAPPASGNSPAHIMSVALRALPASALHAEPAPQRLAPELIAFHRSEHPVSEQYRTLAES